MQPSVRHDSPHHLQFLLVGLLLAASSMLFAADDTCNGYSTILYTDDKTVLTICHGPYTKIDRKGLENWQGCDDGFFLMRDKENGTTRQYADCLSDAGKQFRIHNGDFMLRHFEDSYPGFEPEPLLIEIHNLKTHKVSYEFERQFPACTGKDIDDAAEQVNSTLAQPFDGKTYFTSLYGGLYRLRDCAKSDPQRVLSLLHNLQKSSLFDGETAETLNSVTSDVELIHAATMH